MKYGDLVYCKWVDAVSSDEAWNQLDELLKEKPAVCHTVGWVVKHDDECLTLVAGYCDDVDEPVVGPWTIIPAGWIKEIRRLKYE